jgi:hypothetical protein
MGGNQMNLDIEIKVNQLAKKLSALDQKILKGQETPAVRKDFIETQDKLKEFLLDSGPLDEIRDPETRDILRKVMKADYFVIDRRTAEFQESWNTASDSVRNAIRKILENKGILVTDSEVDEERIDTYARFREEMVELIDPFEYFDRKEKFGPIIANTRLPKAIHTYFYRVKECFLFDQMYAVTGLCRVLLEVAFKDKYEKLGLRKGTQKVSDMEDYKIKTVFREVCSRLRLKIYGDVKELYGNSSDILHGRDPKMEMSTDNVLIFIHDVFGVIERLYA